MLIQKHAEQGLSLEFCKKMHVENLQPVDESSKWSQSLGTHFLAEFAGNVSDFTHFVMKLNSGEDTTTNLLNLKRKFMNGILAVLFSETQETPNNHQLQEQHDVDDVNGSGWFTTMADNQQ